MTVTTFLRGFKVPLPTLDAFLLANNINESEMICRGIPPLYSKDDQVTTLLRNKLGNKDAKTRIFIPSRTGFEDATSAYIAYDWIVVLVQRRLGRENFADNPPPGFEDLRREILSYANRAESLIDDAQYQNAVYVVITDEQTYVPHELKPRLLVVPSKTFADIEAVRTAQIEAGEVSEDSDGSEDSDTPLETR